MTRPAADLDAVLAAVDERAADAVDLLADLVRVPSVCGTDEEAEIQQSLARLAEDDGLDVERWRIDVADLAARDDFPGMEVERTEGYGVVARLPGTGAPAPDGTAPASLMLLCHVDVVPPGDLGAWTAPEPFAAQVRHGHLLGRGACDMKGGLVSAVLAARALRGTPLRGDLLLAFVEGEEDGGLGTYAMLDRGWRADACVIPEPTGLDVVPANGGALTFRLRVHGRATHASRRTEGVSAIEKLVPFLAALRDLEHRRNADVDPLMRRWPVAYPISVGTVHAGDWASTVPDLLVADGRLGVALDEPVEEARAALESAVAEAAAADPWLRDHPVDVEWWGGQFAAGRSPDGDLLAQRVGAAHRTAAGSSYDVWGGPYGSDLRLLAGHGVATVQYGPGDAALAHAPDERVPLDEVVSCARTLAALALDICG